MSELRRDPVSGRWVIISAERGRRSTDFVNEDTGISADSCPLCGGSESETLPEITAYREDGGAANSPGWHVRVVPNNFPALRVEGGLDKRGRGPYDVMSGVGAHEVIIDNPRHVVSLSELERKDVADVLWMYRDRLADLKRDTRLRYGMIFKNVGRSAGAGMEHCHSQLIATPAVPATVQIELDGAKRFFDYHGRCIYCDILRYEFEQDERVVMRSLHFAAIEPFAPRFPFETWIVPLQHTSSYEDIRREVADDLAGILQATLAKIEKVLENPPYNYVLHTGPFDAGEIEHYHWHMEIIPRVTRIAGFEWGTGFYINPVFPEDAAKFLREAEE